MKEEMVPVKKELEAYCDLAPVSIFSPLFYYICRQINFNGLWNVKSVVAVVSVDS